MNEAALPKSLRDNPRLDAWLAFPCAGRARLRTGKVEIGQGILTALAQIAAHELGLSPEQIEVVSGQTPESPAEGSTSGSNSVAVSGSSIRMVCEEVRALFVSRLARVLDCAEAEITISDGAFLRNGQPSGHDYWTLAAQVGLAREFTGAYSATRPGEAGIVGHSFPRLDLPAKITGAAFIHDMAPAKLLHARMLRQPTRAARLRSFDEEAIRRAASPPVQILREGSLVALVAEDEAAVRRALAAARRTADWEHRSPPPDDVGRPEWLVAQPSIDWEQGEGEPSPCGRGTEVRARFARPFLFHGSIGPSCALAEYSDGLLRVWSHSQDVFSLRRWLAATLSLEETAVEVLHRQGAGAYGHNSADDAAFDAAFVAMRNPGRPVRVQWTREDEFSAAPPIGAAMVVDLRAVVDKNGRPCDWTIEIWSPVHGRRPGANGHANLLGAEAMTDAIPSTEIRDTPIESGGGAIRNARAPYDLPHHRLIHHLLPQVPVRTSSLRALGSFANVFAIESFMDELAERAGEDPLAYRLSLTSDPRARAVMTTAAEMAGWGRGERPLGLGFSRYKNRAAYVAVVAEVEVEEEVRVRRAWAAVDAGLVINPDGAASQIEGGIVQATSWTLKEEVRFEQGRVVSCDWDGYPILRFSETPEVEIRFVSPPGEPALGLGEAAQGPTAGAIGNAVKQVLGVRLHRLPLSRERVMAALLE